MSENLAQSIAEFPAESAEEYLGEDLIITTGAPGSGWSGVLKNFTVAREINKSDVLNHKLYKGPNSHGHHMGTYFGPYEAFGKNFDKLDQLSKDEIVSEFKRSYQNFDGVKILKSHHFAYFLDYLYELFPKARFVLFYRDNDQLTFDWWHKCGGWEISHPRYEWYENDERMMQQIRIENAAVHKFIAEKKCYVFNSVMDIKIIFQVLGLTFEEEDVDDIIFKTGPAFRGLTRTEKYYKLRYGTRLNSDPFMYTAIL